MYVDKCVYTQFSNALALIPGAARTRRIIGRPMSQAHRNNLVGSPTNDKLTQNIVCFPTAGERYRHSPSAGERFRRFLDPRFRRFLDP